MSNETAANDCEQKPEECVGGSPLDEQTNQNLGPIQRLNERYAVVTGGKNTGRIVDLSDPREPQFHPRLSM